MAKWKNKSSSKDFGKKSKGGRARKRGSGRGWFGDSLGHAIAGRLGGLK